MVQSIIKFLKFASTTGIYLPGAYDNRTKKGSVSLLFAHITFFLTILGLIALLLTNLQAGVYCSIGYSVLMLSFYLIRSLDKVKFGKDGVELDGEDESPMNPLEKE